MFDDNFLWFKDAIIYELHIKAFRDSNGDGIGDFAGLMEKLDYLQELGVTAIWVLPFYPSPLKDDGYDIADYYSINPRYGNLDDFKNFLEEAHKRGLKVITELVLNHTSDQHPWFQRARNAPIDSAERNFYVWSDDPGKYKDVRIIFQDFETSNWTWDAVAKQYYWHRFFHHQPDLNFDNPLVQEEIFKVIDFWCEMGVDGFRLDAVPYLYEREGTNGENLPETHAFLKSLRKHIDEKYPATVFLAEANMWPEDSASYFGNGDECHMNYHFPVMPRMFMSLQQEDRYPVTDIFDQTPPIPDNCQWAIFLRNHDELTLEMVTDEERDFMYKVYAKDPKARINLGIRHRLAPLMDNNRRKIELMNSLLFSLPGTPVVYYGDEIGMGDNFYLGDRDGVRTPMQWSADRNAGFSSANPQMLYLPVISDPAYNYESVNVELQQRNTSSLFWYMKRMIDMRKSFRAFSRGDLKFINSENPKILAFTRTFEEETILVVVNLSKFAQPAEIELEDYKGFIPVEVFSRNRFPAIRQGQPYFFTLGAHSFQWFLLQKTQAGRIHENHSIPELEDVTDITRPAFREALEKSVFPVYLPQRKWFMGRHRRIYGMTISDFIEIPLNGHTVFLLYIEVSYESGLPDTYQFAMTTISGETANLLEEDCPEAIVGKIKIKGEEQFLCDAFYLKALQQMLFEKLAANESIELKEGSIVFTSTEELTRFAKEHPLHPKMHLANENNTSVTYNNRYFLKLYRKVEPFVNPDVELTKLLSEKGFRYTPGYSGTIEWQRGKGNLVIGFMQTLIENHGDGYTFMRERVTNYIDRILARSRETLDPNQRHGDIANPVSYDELPDDLKILLGSHAAEEAKLIGERTAELHLALLDISFEKDFLPEDFSLHYQRSLFSSMQSLVREGFSNMEKSVDMPALPKEYFTKLLPQKDKLLELLKRIYEKKLDVVKIRNHGNFRLQQVLLSGRDIFIHDFGGNTARAFSERRLKRSALRDIAQMICSFYYVAYDGFRQNNHMGGSRLENHFAFIEYWAYYMSSFFFQAWLEKVKGSPLVPPDKKQMGMLLETYLVERALKNLTIDILNGKQQAVMPAVIMENILNSNAAPAELK
jgi:maltose alpha-D-glucosyltransferase / alpha-amylase